MNGMYLMTVPHTHCSFSLLTLELFLISVSFQIMQNQRLPQGSTQTARFVLFPFLNQHFKDIQNDLLTVLLLCFLKSKNRGVKKLQICFKTMTLRAHLLMAVSFDVLLVALINQLWLFYTSSMTVYSLGL